MTNAEIDACILRACGMDWTKVAMVFARVDRETGVLEKDWGGRLLTKRLIALLRKGEIISAGNIHRWRWSEVKIWQRELR